MSRARAIAAWAADLTWQDVPAGPGLCTDDLGDVLSVMFAGTLTTSARIAARYARLSPGTVPLAAGGTAAAFANGVAAAALDSEDGHYPGGAMHPASVVCASALASAPPHATVADLLTAQIAGFEVCLRAAATWWPDARVLLIFEGAEETLSLRVIGRTLTGAGL